MYRTFWKHFLDIAVSLCLLPFAFLICLVLCIVIFLEDRKNPFYCAPRAGINGRTFTMFKLRTMKKNAPDLRNPDGSTFSAEQDFRLTRAGRIIRKLSLDELPQLLNVLKGDMSLIGPRPDLPSQIVLYTKSETERLSVLPGITGYAQAYFRNALPWKERIPYDIFYTQHISFKMDLKILIKTVSTVVQKKNVFSADGGNTASKG